MKGVFGRLKDYFTEKKLKKADLIWIAAVFLCVSFVSRMSYYYDFSFDRSMEIEAPWLVKGDQEGNLYILDAEKSRVLKVTDGELKTVIHGNNPREDTFYYADNICISEDGSLYVSDVGWSLTGFSLDYERILRYDEKGNVAGICYDADYSGQYCDKHRIFAMEARKGFLYFVTADEAGFVLHRVNEETMEEEIVSRWTMEAAITYIQDFVVDPETEGVYAIDKRGALLYGAGNSDEISQLYEYTGDDRIVFYRGGIGENGSVYVTDIGSKQLLRFAEERDFEMEIVARGENMWNVSHIPMENGTGLLSYISDDTVCVADEDGKLLESFTEVKKSTNYMVKELLFDLAILVGAIGFLYLLLRVVGLLFRVTYSNTQKVGILVICTVVAISVILVYGLLGQFRETYRDELLTKLTMASYIVSNSMSEEEIEDIDAPKNFMNENYQSLWNKMDDVVDRHFAYSEDLYCNILRYDGTKAYAVAYLDNSIGTYYPLTAAETEEIKAVYGSGESYQSDVQSETGSYIYVHSPIFNDEGEVIAVVSVGTLSEVLEGKISSMTQSIVITMIMIIVAVMFLFSEAMSFFDLKERYGNRIRKDRKAVPMHVVRILVFITFLAFNMASSFLPVYIIRFVNDSIGMPAALANALPITLNLIAVGITSVFCPGMMKKLGFAKLAMLSGGFALIGDCFMAIGTGYGMIVLGMVLNGIGVGFITNSIHIFIASLAADGEEDEGFSLFNAASISGINCGMLFGSSLAERIGQSSVFFVSAGIWGVVVLVFLLVGNRMVLRQSRAEVGEAKGGMLRFLWSPSVLKFMICIQVPYIVMSSFVYYYVPIYGAETGLTENVTSLLMITCSLCSVYLSVAATNYLTKKFGGRAMYLSGILTFAGMLIFIWKMTLPSLFLALILIGIANSFGPSTRTDYFIRMEESVRYGEDNAMGSYDLVDNIGESTGSIIFSSIISIGLKSGILGLIACVAGLNTVYALTERNKKKKALAS